MRSVMVLLVLTYTLLGGMVSVVVTDYIQFIVMTAGIVRAEILNEQWDGRTYFIVAKITADPNQVARAIDSLIREISALAAETASAPAPGSGPATAGLPPAGDGEKKKT